MERITATADTLMRQAQDTAEVSVSNALRWVKATDLPHKDWSTYVGIYVQAATQDVLAAAVRAGVQEVTAGLARLERAITLLAEARESRRDQAV